MEMTEGASFSLELAKIVIPSVITAAGWIVVFKQSSTLKYRDEVKSLVDQSIILVDDIYELCCQYYTGDKEEHIGITSANIRAKFLLLSHYFLLMKMRGVNVNFSPNLIAYRRAVMGGYFETEQFRSQFNIPDKKSEISNSRSELSFRVQKSFIDWSRSIGFISQFKLK